MPKLSFDRERGGRARLGYNIGQPRTIGTHRPVQVRQLTVGGGLKGSPLMTRRSLIGGMTAGALAPAVLRAAKPGSAAHVAVIGAGVFGVVDGGASSPRRPSRDAGRHGRAGATAAPAPAAKAG